MKHALLTSSQRYNTNIKITNLSQRSRTAVANAPMLHAINQSSLLASPAPLERFRNTGTDARGTRKKDHRRHSESGLLPRKRTSLAPASPSFLLQATEDQSSSRPGCRKRKCRVDVFRLCGPARFCAKLGASSPCDKLRSSEITFL